MKIGDLRSVAKSYSTHAIVVQQRQNMMPPRRVLIVVLMTFVSLTLYNTLYSESSSTLHMVKKQMAVSSRWGVEHYVTQSGGECEDDH